MSDIRLRPWRRDGRAHIEIRDLEQSRSYQGDSLAIARAILAEALETPAAPKRYDLREFGAWRANGWADALPFFLATLDGDYRDAKPDYRASQESVLDSYQAAGALPVEQLPKEVDWLRLPPARPHPQSRSRTLTERRTTLVPPAHPLPLLELASILWESSRKLAAFRIPEIEQDHRKAMVNFGPSLDLYVVVYDVHGLEPGLYRFDVKGHRLGRLTSGDLRLRMRKVIVGQPAPMTAAATVLYVSDVSRHRWRYRHERALRGLWIDTAKVANELLWSLAARSIVPHMTPAIADGAAGELLGIGDAFDKQVVYAISFAGPPPSADNR